MLCLSGFELYSRWVPLIKLQDVGACIFHRHSVVPELWSPPSPPPGHYCPWDSPFGVVDCLGALGNESIHEDNLGDDTPFINNNLTLLGSEIRFTQWPSGSKKGTRTSLLFYFKDFFSLGKSCESLKYFFARLLQYGSVCVWKRLTKVLTKLWKIVYPLSDNLEPILIWLWQTISVKVVTESPQHSCRSYSNQL